MPSTELELRIRADLADATAKLRAVEKQVGAIGKNAGTAQRRANLFARSLDRIGRASRVSVSNLAHMTVVMQGLANAARRVGGAATGFARFEYQLAQLQGLVGLSAHEVDNLGNAVAEMAPRVGRGANELARGLYDITSAGLRGDEALDVLEQSARAATAGLGETAKIAGTITGALEAYAGTALTAGDVTGQLIVAVREGKLPAEELAGQMGRLLNFGAELGIEFGELAGVMSALSRTNIDAATSATGLAQLMGRLLAPTAEAAKAMEEANLRIDDIRKTVAEQGLQEGLRQMAAAFEGNDLALVQAVGGLEGYRVALGLTGKTAAETARIIAETLAGSVADADRAFAAVAETTEVRYNRAMERLQKIWLEFAADAIPKLLDGLAEIGNAIDYYAEKFESLFSSPAQAVELGAGEFSGAYGEHAERTEKQAERIRKAILGAQKVEADAAARAAPAARRAAPDEGRDREARAAEERAERDAHAAARMYEFLAAKASFADEFLAKEAERTEQALERLTRATRTSRAEREKFSDFADALSADPYQARAESLDRLEISAADTAENMKRAFAGTFRTLEDELVGFVTRGEASFSRFVDAIIADIARLAIRRSITEPLANAFGAAIGSLFHAGGVVGQTPAPARPGVPPWMWAAAPRLHAGGAIGLKTDEVPAILQRGEVVLPRGSAPPSAAPAQVTVAIENRGAPQRIAEASGRLDGGRLVIGIVAEDIAEGGPAAAAIQRTFGISPALA